MHTAQEHSLSFWQLWWPALIPIAATIWVVVVELAGHPELHAKSWQEVIAIILTFSALGVASAHFLLSREPYYMVLDALAIAFFFRELHFDWTTKAVYVALAVIFIWAFIWRKPLLEFLQRYPRARAWLILAGCTYVLSQLIARRALQNVIGEDVFLSHFMNRIDGDLEEFIENSAHALLLLAGAAGDWGRPTDRKLHDEDTS